jgi:GGDEF domain-containing protein
MISITRTMEQLEAMSRGRKQSDSSHDATENAQAASSALKAPLPPPVPVFSPELKRSLDQILSLIDMLLESPEKGGFAGQAVKLTNMSDLEQLQEELQTRANVYDQKRMAGQEALLTPLRTASHTLSSLLQQSVPVVGEAEKRMENELQRMKNTPGMRKQAEDLLELFSSLRRQHASLHSRLTDMAESLSSRLSGSESGPVQRAADFAGEAAFRDALRKHCSDGHLFCLILCSFRNLDRYRRDFSPAAVTELLNLASRRIVDSFGAGVECGEWTADQYAAIVRTDRNSSLRVIRDLTARLNQPATIHTVRDVDFQLMASVGVAEHSPRETYDAFARKADQLLQAFRSSSPGTR